MPSAQTDSEKNEAEALAAGATVVTGSGLAKGEASTGPVIAQAVGTAVNSIVPGLAARLEAAMVAAVVQAHDEGINDPDEIKVRKQRALESELEAVWVQNEASSAAAQAGEA